MILSTTGKDLGINPNEQFKFETTERIDNCTTKDLQLGTTYYSLLNSINYN